MAFEIPGTQYSFEAGGDLHLKRYFFVKLNSDGECVICDGNTDNPLGILQNTPTEGQMATVMVNGMSKVVAGSNFAKGDYVGTDSDGKAEVYAHGADTTKYIVGQVILDNSAEDGIATILFNCVGVARAT